MLIICVNLCVLIKTCKHYTQTFGLQMWYETDKSELVLSQLLCLEAGDNFPRLYKCHEMGDNQEWKKRGHVSTAIKLTYFYFYYQEVRVLLCLVSYFYCLKTFRRILQFITWHLGYVLLLQLQAKANFSPSRSALTKVFMNGT